MGVLFLEHPGGSRIFCCSECNTALTNLKEIASKDFRGSTGIAYLFNKVVNLIYSGTDKRPMISGVHIVRDVSCKVCKAKLGWMYEFTENEDQRYKEGRIVLERALITCIDGNERREQSD